MMKKQNYQFSFSLEVEGEEKTLAINTTVMKEKKKRTTTKIVLMNIVHVKVFFSFFSDTLCLVNQGALSMKLSVVRKRSSIDFKKYLCCLEGNISNGERS